MSIDDDAWRADPITRRHAGEYRKERGKAFRHLVSVSLTSGDPLVRASAERYKMLVAFTAKLDSKQSTDEVHDEEDV
jgi:hypothetical protein